MTIIIKRYRVRHNDVVYGPGQPAGQVIEGLSEEEEARLIDGSNGTIERHVPPEAVEDNTENDGETKPAPTGNAGEAAPTDTDPDTESLININPDELIKSVE